MTFSQSPALGTEQERTRALECMLEAEARRTSKAARSILYERGCCWTGLYPQWRTTEVWQQLLQEQKYRKEEREEWQVVPDDEFN